MLALHVWMVMTTFKLLRVLKPGIMPFSGVLCLRNCNYANCDRCLDLLSIIHFNLLYKMQYNENNVIEHAGLGKFDTPPSTTMQIKQIPHERARSLSFIILLSSFKPNYSIVSWNYAHFTRYRVSQKSRHLFEALYLKIWK